MALIPSWRPDVLGSDSEELIASGLHQAALEVTTLAIETEIRYALDRFHVPKDQQAIVFEQARCDARLIDPDAPIWTVRLSAALAIRKCVRAWCLRQLAAG